MDIFQLFLSIRGRINRTTYWCAIFPLIIGYLIAEVLTASAKGSVAGPGYLIMAVLIWPSLAVQTKRWHDRDKSGWWNLIGLIPIVGPIWAFVELGFLKGTPGANRYDLRPVPHPCYDYAVPINNTQEDAYIGQPHKESEPVTQGSSVNNSWRNQ